VHWVLIYDLVDDYVERRAPLRAAHLTLAREARARGELVLAGALDEPVDQAVLVFEADDRSTAEEFARRDPYVLNGLVTDWRVRHWNAVVGTAFHEERHDAPSLWAQADLVTPMALRVAATLGLADHLAAGTRDMGELARATHTEVDALERLMRHLHALRLVTRATDGTWSLTDRGQALRRDHPGGLARFLDQDGALGRADLAFVDLLQSVRTGEAAFPVRYGQPFWADLAADAARTASFDEQMGADVAAWAPHVLAAYDWGSLDHLVDVGGGNGTLLIAILEAHPSLRGTVFDQPATIAAAESALDAAGLGARSDVVAGSFFDEIPIDADGYLLSAILHDWDDDAALRILQRCAAAAGAKARVFVVEKTGADGESPRTDMDLRLLVYMAGRERGVAELSALATKAGLRVEAVHRGGELSVLVLVAA
jgi:uncharacterized protein YciI